MLPSKGSSGAGLRVLDRGAAEWRAPWQGRRHGAGSKRGDLTRTRSRCRGYPNVVGAQTAPPERPEKVLSVTSPRRGLGGWTGEAIRPNVIYFTRRRATGATLLNGTVSGT
jgi:hypothetical protein